MPFQVLPCDHYRWTDDVKSNFLFAWQLIPARHSFTTKFHITKIDSESSITNPLLTSQYLWNFFLVQGSFQVSELDVFWRACQPGKRGACYLTSTIGLCLSPVKRILANTRAHYTEQQSAEHAHRHQYAPQMIPAAFSLHMAYEIWDFLCSAAFTLLAALQKYKVSC